MPWWGDVLVGLGIAMGLVGIVVPVLPGSALVVGSVLVWAIIEATTAAWVTFAVVAVLVGAAALVKYLIPGQRLKAAGVPVRVLTLAALAGLVGFFVIPVVGLPLFFVAAVYLAERQRLGDDVAARTSTKHALKAVGLSIAIELAAGMIAALTWIGVVVLA